MRIESELQVLDIEGNSALLEGTFLPAFGRLGENSATP